MLRCIIVDEAHRAIKDYAYVQVNCFNRIIYLYL